MASLDHVLFVLDLHKDNHRTKENIVAAVSISRTAVHLVTLGYAYVGGLVHVNPKTINIHTIIRVEEKPELIRPKFCSIGVHLCSMSQHHLYPTEKMVGYVQNQGMQLLLAKLQLYRLFHYSPSRKPHPQHLC